MSKRLTTIKLCICAAGVPLVVVGGAIKLLSPIKEMKIYDKKTGFNVAEFRVITNNEKQEKGYIFFDGNVMKSTCDFVNHQNECIPALEENKEKIIEQLKIYNSQEFTYQVGSIVTPEIMVLFSMASIFGGACGWGSAEKTKRNSKSKSMSLINK